MALAHRDTPTRQMIQNFATEIASDEFSKSWVTRFLNRRLDQLFVKWSDPMTVERHNAESYDKYKEYFDVLQLKLLSMMCCLRTHTIWMRMALWLESTVKRTRQDCRTQ